MREEGCRICAAAGVRPLMHSDDLVCFLYHLWRRLSAKPAGLCSPAGVLLHAFFPG